MNWLFSLSAVASLKSIFNMISADDQDNLAEDEDTPEKRADKIWNFFGKKEDGESGKTQDCWKAELNSF